METNELERMRAKLIGFNARCGVITTLLGDKRVLSREERAHAEELYRSLKEDLKRCAAFGTLSGKRGVLTDAEERFYSPAVKAAALALAPAVNSHPISSNWFSALYDAQIEFGHYMPEVA